MDEVVRSGVGPAEPCEPEVAPGLGADQTNFGVLFDRFYRVHLAMICVLEMIIKLNNKQNQEKTSSTDLASEARVVISIYTNCQSLCVLEAAGKADVSVVILRFRVAKHGGNKPANHKIRTLYQANTKIPILF